MIRTWKQVHKIYERLRERYFKEFDLPPATEIKWIWQSDKTPWLGETHLDDDGDPFLITLHPNLRHAHRFLEDTILHEMMHIKLGADVSCRYPSKKWQEEIDRLYRLGAIWI